MRRRHDCEVRQHNVKTQRLSTRCTQPLAVKHERVGFRVGAAVELRCLWTETPNKSCTAAAAAAAASPRICRSAQAQTQRRTWQQLCEPSDTHLRCVSPQECIVTTSMHYWCSARSRWRWRKGSSCRGASVSHRSCGATSTTNSKITTTTALTTSTNDCAHLGATAHDAATTSHPSAAAAAAAAAAGGASIQ